MTFAFCFSILFYSPHAHVCWRDAISIKYIKFVLTKKKSVNVLQLENYYNLVSITNWMIEVHILEKIIHFIFDTVCYIIEKSFKLTARYSYWLTYRSYWFSRGKHLFNLSVEWPTVHTWWLCLKGTELQTWEIVHNIMLIGGFQYCKWFIDNQTRYIKPSSVV